MTPKIVHGRSTGPNPENPPPPGPPPPMRPRPPTPDDLGPWRLIPHSGTPSRAEIATRVLVTMIGGWARAPDPVPLDNRTVAFHAVHVADALIAELAKPGPAPPKPEPPPNLETCDGSGEAHEITDARDAQPASLSGREIRAALDSKAHEITDGLFRDPSGRMGSLLTLDAKSGEQISEWTRADTHEYVFQELRQLVNSLRLAP